MFKIPTSVFYFKLIYFRLSTEEILKLNNELPLSNREFRAHFIKVDWFLKLGGNNFPFLLLEVTEEIVSGVSH